MATSYYLCNLGGANPAGDQWQIGAHFSSDAALLDAVLTAWTSFADTLWNEGGGSGTGYGSLCVAGTSPSRLSVTQLDPTTGRNLGRMDSTPTVTVTPATGAPLPPQCAVVISLRTALATRGGRGRFFLPAPAASTLETDGTLKEADAETIALAVAAAMEQMITATNPILPIIWHRTTKTASLVLSGDIGNVFDTQRRRRNKLVESRLPIAF